MNLRQLEVFQAVLQTGSIGAAARLLCITPQPSARRWPTPNCSWATACSPHPGGPSPPQRPRCWPWSPGHLPPARRPPANCQEPGHHRTGRCAIGGHPSITHEFLPTLLQHALQHPRSVWKCAPFTRTDDAGLAHAQCGFWSGLFEHPHPRCTANCSSAAACLWRWRARCGIAPACSRHCRAAGASACHSTGGGRPACASPSTHRSAWAPRPASGADLAAGAGAGAAGHGLDGGGLPHRHSPGPGPSSWRVELHDLATHVALPAITPASTRRACIATRMLAMLPALLHQPCRPATRMTPQT